MTTPPFVSVVIPTYNRKDKLIRLISTVFASEYPQDRIEIIVVDDCSSDLTSDILKDTYPSVKVIHNETELLLAGSRNKGIVAARGELIFLVDDDNVLDKNCISQLVRTMTDPSHPNLGVVAPIAMYLNVPNVVWWKGTDRSMYTSITTLKGRGEIITDDCRLIPSTDGINAFMVKREVFTKVGTFDSIVFPIHYDEADFGERVRMAGYEVVVDSSSRTWHDIPPFDANEDKARAFHCQNEKRAYYCARNRMAFHNRYSLPVQRLSFFLVFNWIVSMLYIRVILIDSKYPGRKKISLANAYMRGLWDGLEGLLHN